MTPLRPLTSTQMQRVCSPRNVCVQGREARAPASAPVHLLADTSLSLRDGWDGEYEDALLHLR